MITRDFIFRTIYFIYIGNKGIESRIKRNKEVPVGGLPRSNDIMQMLKLLAKLLAP